MSLESLFSGYSGGRRGFVVDQGGWEIERVAMSGDGWRDAHDHVANVLFDIAFHSGLCGSTEPRGIFSQAVPAEVLTAMIQEAADEGGRRSRPGAIPDAAIVIGGRRLLYDVKLIRFCPTRYWPTIRVADARGGMLEHRASLVPGEYLIGAQALDARTARWYAQTGRTAPVGAPTAVEILRQFPPVAGLVFGSTACGGSREVGTLISHAATSAAQRQWRLLGTRSLSEARAYMMRMMRQQVSFAAAYAHARLRLTRLELVGYGGRTAGRYASATAAFISPTAYEQTHGGAMGGGGGRAGFAGGGHLF